VGCRVLALPPSSWEALDGTSLPQFPYLENKEVGADASGALLTQAF
jgi:hypothetical protein